MPQLLHDFADPQVIQSGVVLDPHVANCPVWIEGFNVGFEDGTVKRAGAHAQAFTKPSPYRVSGLQDVLRSGVQNLFFGYSNQLYRWNSTSVTLDGSGYTGNDSPTVNNPASHWSMVDWGTWCLASNNYDRIQVNKLDGAGFQTLTDSPARAKCITRFKNFILAFNVPAGDTAFQWCDVDNPESWTPALSGGPSSSVAGGLNIRDMDSEIQAIAPLGDAIAVYSRNTMAVVRFTGAPYWFGWAKALEGIGAVSPKAVVARGRLNYGVSRNGIWQTDGNTFTYITPPFLRNWFKSQFGWDRASLVTGYLNEERSTIEWGFPLVGGGGITVSLNYETGAWSFKSQQITASLPKRIFQYPTLGFYDGVVSFGESGTSANGVGIDSFVRTKPLTAKDPRQIIHVDHVRVLAHNVTGTFNLLLGLKDSIYGGTTWLDPQPITNGWNVIPYFGADAAAITLKFQSTAVDAQWTLSGFHVFGEVGGYDV